MSYQAGRHFLQIPGPTNVPDRVLRAIDNPTIDHRGADFPPLAFACFEGLKKVFATKSEVFIYAASGSGAWEAALVNTLSPGDRVVVFDSGHFAALWTKMAGHLGLTVDSIACDWRQGPDATALAAKLAADPGHEIKAVLVIHNETATGITCNMASIRKTLDDARHPALLLVDSISGLGSMDYRHDEWGIDVTISGSQKGLMLPPGLGFHAVSAKALEAGKTSKMPKAYWRWDDMLAQNRTGFFPTTPATNLLYGMKEALAMLEEEGLENVFARHKRHAEATRRAVRAWGLEVYAQNEAAYSSALTSVLMPEGFDEAALRRVIFQKFNMSLGAGLSRLAGKVFRIGHLGYFNDLMLAGTLSGVEMGLKLAGVPHKRGGVDAALEYLSA